jgi:uncharacterized protein (UPF0218 family)
VVLFASYRRSLMQPRGAVASQPPGESAHEQDVAVGVVGDVVAYAADES